MASEVILRINNLHVSIEDTEILRGLDLEIRSGEIHALMGRNGSGKSTLANVLMGHPAYESPMERSSFSVKIWSKWSLGNELELDCSYPSNTHKPSPVCK